MIGGVKYPLVGKFAIFDQHLAVSWKQYKRGPSLLWNVDGKSYVLSRIVQFPMTLSDPEMSLSMSNTSPWHISRQHYVAYDRPSTGEVLLKVICGHVRDGTGSVTLTRDPTRDASDP